VVNPLTKSQLRGFDPAFQEIVIQELQRSIKESREDNCVSPTPPTTLTPVKNKLWFVIEPVLPCIDSNKDIIREWMNYNADITDVVCNSISLIITSRMNSGDTVHHIFYLYAVFTLCTTIFQQRQRKLSVYGQNVGTLPPSCEIPLIQQHWQDVFFLEKTTHLQTL
jgi:hypothetical protein